MILSNKNLSNKKILNYGSLNIDEVFSVPHFVRPGETLACKSMTRFTGGKGLNQSVALAKAGADVLHLGAVGADGQFLVDALRFAGADTSAILKTDTPTGRAVIEVDESGQNRILLLPGANAEFVPDHILKTLDFLSPGDWLLTQNETANVGFVLFEAKKRGLHTAFNPSPFDPSILSLPLECVDLFFVNEVEGEALSGEKDPDKMIFALLARFPDAKIVLTLGADGSLYADKNTRFRQNAFPVKVEDTTAAGDTFTGFFLASMMQGKPVEECMRLASTASAIAVSRKGAAPSIPTKAEVEAFE